MSKEPFKVSHSSRGEIESKEKDPFEPIMEYSLIDGMEYIIDWLMEEIEEIKSTIGDNK